MGGITTPAQFLGVPVTGGTFTGPVTVQGALSTSGINNITAGGSLIAQAGIVDVQAAGQGLRVAEGSNAKQGTATLVAGTVTVADTSVTASSRIFCSGNAAGGTAGGVNNSARTVGTSFTLTSTNAADTSAVAYLMNEPG